MDPGVKYTQEIILAVYYKYITNIIMDHDIIDIYIYKWNYEGGYIWI